MPHRGFDDRLAIAPSMSAGVASTSVLSTRASRQRAPRFGTGLLESASGCASHPCAESMSAFRLKSSTRAPPRRARAHDVPAPTAHSQRTRPGKHVHAWPERAQHEPKCGQAQSVGHHDEVSRMIAARSSSPDVALGGSVLAQQSKAARDGRSLNPWLSSAANTCAFRSTISAQTSPP